MEQLRKTEQDTLEWLVFDSRQEQGFFCSSERHIQIDPHSLLPKWRRDFFPRWYKGWTVEQIVELSLVTTLRICGALLPQFLNDEMLRHRIWEPLIHSTKLSIFTVTYKLPVIKLAYL